MGTPAPGNIPSARDSGNTWVDTNGKLWLFGGRSNFNPQSSGQLSLNDLWEFDPSTAEWTWIGGTNQADAPSVYGNLGIPAAGVLPGGRSGAASWTDTSGNFWLFGGVGVPNDFWMYSPATNQWAWMGGGAPTVR